MGRKSEKEEKAPPAGDADSEEKKRLRTLAISKKILRRSPANSSSPLNPSNAIIKLQGRDIVKRGQRKSRYLFSFPGLIGPLSGGKVGVLANLATKNPVLYLEFPQGRMKLFGTHVYPKNKYLTLQLTKSAKGVMCEDVFESLIVFSEAWWIGQQDENPEEYQLEFPKDLVEGKDSDYDFKGGAGATHEESSGVQKNGKGYLDPPSPDNELESDDSDDLCTVISKNEKKTIETTPLRQSARTSRKVSYAESASEKDSTDSDTEAVDGNELRINDDPDAKAKSPVLINRDYSGVVGTTVSSPETETIATEEILSEEPKQSPQKSTRKSPNKKGTLVQASLSSLFEKVADKKSKRDVDAVLGTKNPSGKRQRLLAKDKTDAILDLPVKASSNKGKKSSGKSGTGSRTATMRKKPQEADDWSDDISSDSEDEDEDWVA